MKEKLKEKLNNYLLNHKIPYVSHLIFKNQQLEEQAIELQNKIHELDYELHKIIANLEENFRAEFKLKNRDERAWEGSTPQFKIEIKPSSNYPQTVVIVEKERQIFQDTLLYSHLGLAKLITDYHFDTILDIGSGNGTASQLFSFLGKDVTSIELSEESGADYTGDYLEIDFPQQFDAIWCSHVLEHQRNIGIFLEKIYRDLKEEGVLAITVPYALSPLMMGHPNIFTPLHLIYHLVLAGFNCNMAKIRTYDWQFTILLKKHSNNIKPISLATTHFDGTIPIGYVPELLDFFPLPIPKNGHVWGEIESLNWD